MSKQTICDRSHLIHSDVHKVKSILHTIFYKIDGQVVLLLCSISVRRRALDEPAKQVNYRYFWGCFFIFKIIIIIFIIID